MANNAHILTQDLLNTISTQQSRPFHFSPIQLKTLHTLNTYFAPSDSAHLTAIATLLLCKSFF
jgi:hypothetical protein